MSDRFFCTLVGLCFLFFSQGVAANWVLDKKQSSLSWLSSKLLQKSHKAIYEHNHFRDFSVFLTADGVVQAEVNLNSVDTRVAIRDDRIRKYVFATDKYPVARLHGKVDVDELTDLAVGASLVKSPDFVLEMRARSHKLSPKISITKLGKHSFAIQTIEPVLLDATAFGMAEGFEKLREIVQLFNIPTVIPVSFRMIFMQSTAKAH